MTAEPDYSDDLEGIVDPDVPDYSDDLDAADDPDVPAGVDLFDDLDLDVGAPVRPAGVDLWDEIPTPWRTKGLVDIIEMIQPRRMELLEPDELQAWFDDLSAWSWWLIRTYQLHSTFPPCWMHHGALVEELSALWLGWSGVWLSGTDPTGPSSWHYQLDMTVQRVIRWKVSCDSEKHSPDREVDQYPPGSAVCKRWWPALVAGS